MGQTSQYNLRYPELDDPADITQIRTLAEDVDAALGSGNARTFGLSVVGETLLADTVGPYGGGLVVGIPGPRSQVYIANVGFDVMNTNGSPTAASFVGYLHLNGMDLGGFAAIRGPIGTGAVATYTWTGVLPPGSHGFQMYVRSDQWAVMRIWSAALQVVTIP